MYHNDRFHNDYESYQSEIRMAAKQRYFAQTYGLMAAALAITFSVALAAVRFFPQIAYSSSTVLILCVVQLALVISLSRSLTRGNSSSTLVKFLLYAAFTGVSFCSFFLYFQVETLILCFLAAAAAFGGMALYGLRSNRDIIGWSSTLFGCLIGLMIASVVGIFFSLPISHLFLTVFGLLIFLGLTAYDTRKLSLMFDQAAGTERAAVYSIYGAFQLYLDFINLFLYLVRLLGLSSRD